MGVPSPTPQREAWEGVPSQEVTTQITTSLSEPTPFI